VIPLAWAEENFGPFQSVGVRAFGGSGGQPHRDQPHRDQRQPDSCGVGEHVSGIGDQRQRSGDKADDYLDGHEADDQQ